MPLTVGTGMNFKEGSLYVMLGGLVALGAQSASAQSSGPVRMARISYVSGAVEWRPDSGEGWTPANNNQPLRQGAQLWAKNGRVELQFDDGSSARFANGAVVTLQTLYSDNQGEFTELKLSSGTSSFQLKDKYSIYQIDDPDNSIKAVGPSRFRVEANGPVACGVRQGSVTLSAEGHDTTVPAGDRVVMNSANDPVEVRRIGPEDTWDEFNDQRVTVLDEPPAHVPTNIGLVAGGLDRQGHWHFVAGIGWTWAPAEPVGWRPYRYGHWAWVDPFGWTWVSDDPWGWAPYHYGTWANTPYGWAWVPGPAVQYWSPARVDFVTGNGYVSWVPLAPAEVTYPAFSVGFHTGNWWFNFSIGGCAVYQPFGVGYCGPVVYPAYAFSPGYRHGWDPGYWNDHRFGPSRYAFVPRNAAFGAMGVSAHNFVAGGRYDVVNRNATAIFRNRSQAVANRAAFSGPVGLRPNAHSFSPSRAVYASRGPATLNRPVQRAALSSRFNGGRPVASNLARPANAVRRNVGRPANVARPSNVTAARQSIGFHGRAGANYGAARRTTAGRIATAATRVNHGAAAHVNHASAARTNHAGTANRTATRRNVTRHSQARPSNGRGQSHANAARANRAPRSTPQRSTPRRSSNFNQHTNSRSNGGGNRNSGQQRGGGNHGGGGNRGGGGGGGGGDKHDHGH